METFEEEVYSRLLFDERGDYPIDGRMARQGHQRGDDGGISLRVAVEGRS